MPVDWSAGWLLQRMMELEYEPEKWKGQPIGWGLDDPDWDPDVDATIEAARMIPWRADQVEEAGRGE